MTSLLREEVPVPIMCAASATMTSCPANAAARAIARPTTPAPTTRTCIARSCLTAIVSGKSGSGCKLDFLSGPKYGAEPSTPRCGRIDRAPATGQHPPNNSIHNQGRQTMLRTLSLLAIGVCANALVGVTAWTQTPPEVTLTRFDCGIGQSPIDPARFNDTFAFPELKVTITFSCYLVKHGGEYMVWDTGFAVGANPNAPKVSIVDRLKEKGPVMLIGDLAHFQENYDGNGVPIFNTDRAQTLASIDRVKKIAANLKATVIIQHDQRDLGKLPAFPAAAK